MTNTRFSYVQIGSKDYKKLAQFYMDSMDFTPCENDSYLQGKEGIALRAPGFPDGNAPIFGIVKAEIGSSANINDCGFAHTCFETKDVKGAVLRFMKNGGTILSTMSNPQLHPCVYCKDIEGNVVEFHIPFPVGNGISDYLNTAGCLLGLKPDKHLRNNAPKGKEDSIKFIHVNIICPDYVKLCEFYNNVFGSQNFGKLKDHEGSYKEKVIGIPGVHVVGQHVVLPGFYKDYPTLEIFTYSVKGRENPTDENAIGINCIGFSSDDIEGTAKEVEAAGGKIFSKNETSLLVGDIQSGRILLTKN